MPVAFSRIAAILAFAVEGGVWMSDVAIPFILFS